MTKLVIFDVDGTLIDSQAHIVTSLGAAFDAAGLSVPPRDTLLSIVGLSLPIAMAQLAPEADAATLSRMIEAYKAEFYRVRMLEGAAASPLYDGAQAAIHALMAREDIVLAIATGKSRRGLSALLEAWEFSAAFVSTQTADDHPSKPHPAMVLECLLDTGIAAKDALVVGDTTFDIEMARAANVASIGVSWGYHGAGALRETQASKVISQFAELIPAIDDIFGDSA
ncbi:Phosphoglycolate phosphatase [Aquimixticola soesokkakensis]|uniref:Phosphoglycolate phosphatase n=1 Tax=Aquimixticola soesokkakensis TaxID=1519096 RepID=A0A1Y5SZG5_9RHOB|nr:HAD-IA family hydrolase [Aquimixticola soesokkakensis]SLN51647.1 Phosphoglycolate phosphatase [Aquimixticola soesokkakensis]